MLPWGWPYGVCRGGIARLPASAPSPAWSGSGGLPGEHSRRGASLYIDPRIIALYEEGVTIAPDLDGLGQGREFGDVATKGHAERAVLKLITSSSAGVHGS